MTIPGVSGSFDRKALIRKIDHVVGGWLQHAADCLGTHSAPRPGTSPAPQASKAHEPGAAGASSAINTTNTYFFRGK